MPKLSSHLTISFLAHLKLAILAAQSYLHHFIKLYKHGESNHQGHTNQDCVDQVAQDQSRPSPSMVPVPYMSQFMPKLIKNKLPVMAFSEFRSTLEVGLHGDGSCAICLCRIEKREEVRLLGNCSHLFHRECMDRWVDHGHGTCPLCRLKLLPSQTKDVYVKDPWREERIAYLFGEDYVVHGF